ncbi:MAG: arsenical pump-driving ATPase [Firmicutes bacterium]|nr:arsenical pump-driving ATPase [Bacillota bacterium]
MNNTRYFFFTGKGGVGKTSVACATAINLAQSGKKVLLVSTDPASNLDDVLEIKVEQHPTEIPGIPSLWALNLDPEEAAKDYREKVVGDYRGILPDEVIASMEEQLSGACTVEIATFDLFTRLLSDPAVASGYDHIVFDTAPTGHTLRLLALPKAWSGFMTDNVRGTSCIGPLAGMFEQKQRYEGTVAALSDPGLVTLTLVTKPDGPALSEACRASRELGELGLTNQRLIINGVLDYTGNDPVADAFKLQQSESLKRMLAELSQLPSQIVPLLPNPPVGIDGLKLLAERMRYPEKKVIVWDFSNEGSEPPLSIPVGLGTVVDDLNRRERGVILVMGKGGVGKTTVAAAMALALSERGRRVKLSTTDPAAHLDLALAGAGKELTVSRIDPAVEVAAYREEVMSTVGKELDEDGRALLAEELASPCTEEIAVFRAFARTVDQAEDCFVVLDTAPTGHTLLLLDATQSYHRQVENTTGDVPEEVRRLLPRLRDPEFTHILLVTLAQATPVLEAQRLQEDLRRAGIEAAWWLINQTWTGVPTSNSVLRSLSRAEKPWIDKVINNLARKAIRIPWLIKAPRGREGLTQLFNKGKD